MTQTGSKNAAVKVLLLLGPPGSGKGTQAERLAKHLHIPAISTGEMIRAEVRGGTELGRKAQAIMNTGALLDDAIVNDIVASRLSAPDCAAGFMLDGYPRSVPQAEYLGALLARLGHPQPTVIHIDVANEHLIARTCQRRFCTQCGHIYNLLSHSPKQQGICDLCGGALAQRADDREDTVRNRLAAYEKSTAPLIGYYAQGNYYRIDGTGAPDDVFADVLKALEI
ncbi:MAG: adenylate kinase [Bryobacteraceae bacterium]|jgi:adenylate kinase